LLLTSPKNTTVAVALEQFFDDDDSPWNYMMAVANRLFGPADRDLLRIAPLHGVGADPGRRQGLGN